MMSPAARIRRGFTRLGVALAVPCLVIGIAISGIDAHTKAISGTNAHTEAIDTKKPWTLNWAAPPPGLNSISNEELLRALKAPPTPPGFELDRSAGLTQPSYASVFVDSFWPKAAFTSILAAVLFAIPWGLGWIVSGFAREDGAA